MIFPCDWICVAWTPGRSAVLFESVKTAQDNPGKPHDIISRIRKNLCLRRTGISALVEGVREVDRLIASITAATSSSESAGGAPSS